MLQLLIATVFAIYCVQSKCTGPVSVQFLTATEDGKGGVGSVTASCGKSGQSQFTISTTQYGGDVMEETIATVKSVVWHLLDKDIWAEINAKPFGVNIDIKNLPVIKDGPSAGAAMAVAIYSLLTDTPINKNVAITGEVDLLGNLKAVGGIKAKYIGAAQNGIKMMVVPGENVQDVTDIFQSKPIKNAPAIVMPQNLEDAIPFFSKKKSH